MNTLQAYRDLRSLGQPILRTREAAARLRVPGPTALGALNRLERAGFAKRLRQGLWSLVPDPDPLAIAEHLTAPYRSYISFETALFRHGMIEQIPPRVTVASLGRPRTIPTAVGTYVIRHLSPRVFSGYEDRGGTRIATPEKALFDTVYRAAQHGWKTAYFPEIELPDTFESAVVDGWIERIDSPKLRTMVRAVLRSLDVPVAERPEGAARRGRGGPADQVLGRLNRSCTPTFAQPLLGLV